MYNSQDVNSYINVKFKTGESPNNGYAFILTSISSKGSRGALNGYVLNELGLSTSDLPTAKELEKGFNLNTYKSKRVLYIVTVGGTSVNETFRLNLRAALRFYSKDLNWPMWVPLLGTGVGKLTYFESYYILGQELERNRGLHGRGIDMTISLPIDLGVEEWKDILRDISANKILNLQPTSYTEVNYSRPYYKNIIKSEEFYFSKALEAIESLKKYVQPSKGGTARKTKRSSANLLEQLSELWERKNRPTSNEFSMFLQNEWEALVRPFSEVCTLIAYIDRSAWRSAELNNYSPKRYVARAGLRQGQLLKAVFDWVNAGFDVEVSARNTTIFYKVIRFLEDPLNNSSVVSEKHRSWISRHFLKSTYNKDSFEDELFKYFTWLRDKLANPLNFSFLISTVLYHRDFRFQWDEGLEVFTPKAEEKIGAQKSEPKIASPLGNAMGSEFIEEMVGEPNLTDPIGIAKDFIPLTSLNSDSANQQQDLLGFQKDIESFASIVALKDQKPPLAIALFGQWGMGKSFFMQKLSDKVFELAETQGYPDREGLAERLDEEPKKGIEPFCEGVCQIHFNAWSYMDTNLWASLVTRIFEGLDDYVNDNASGADEEKARVKGEIAKQLDVAKGQLDELVAKKKQVEDAKEVLVTEVKKAQKSLNDKVSEIKTSSKQGFIDYALHEFKVKEKLSKVLENSEVRLPKKGNIDPDLILEELKSAHAFVRQFLNLKELNWRWIVPLLFIPILIFVPVDWFGEDISNWINAQLGWVTKTGATALALIGGAFGKTRHALMKLSPIIYEVLKVKETYTAAVQEGIANYEQDILAKRIEADQKEVELNQLTVQLKAKEAEIKALEFSSESGLAHKAMYNFITRKAKSSDYSKHLGIISMIRKDFETLSELFVESRSADPEKLKTKEKTKLDKYNSIRSDFSKPLERIVLYIDDLDRCTEDKVVEVLEAVNLLMAFPLFVVVVGVDPRWVKNALVKKYQFQFTGRLDGTDLRKELDLELISPSDYLEKIFQVPFHLMSPSQDSIKNMIEYLTDDFGFGGMNPLDEFSEELLAEVEEAWDYIDEEEDENSSVGSDIEENPSNTKSNNSGDKKVKDVSEEGIVRSPLSQVTHQALILEKEEKVYLMNLSWLIGNNPRTVKRFVNMYRIIRIHEGLIYKEEEDRIELLLIIFELTLRTGKFSKYSDSIFDAIAHGTKETIQECLDEEFESIRAANDFDYKNLIYYLRSDEALVLVRAQNKDRLNRNFHFIKRFCFPAPDQSLRTKGLIS